MMSAKPGRFNPTEAQRRHTKAARYVAEATPRSQRCSLHPKRVGSTKHRKIIGTEYEWNAIDPERNGTPQGSSAIMQKMTKITAARRIIFVTQIRG
jgi:hypothetical protein